MSSLTLNGDTSGSILIQAPAVAGNGTLTLPTGTATLGVQGPAFSAYQSSAQSVSGATWTKVQFQAEEFDTASCFDSTTNYRFTPNVAGYYQVNANAYIASTNTGGSIAIYKNGSVFKKGLGSASSATVFQGWVVSSLIYLNGSTDYIEVYLYITTGQNLANSLSETYFQASMVRAA